MSDILKSNDPDLLRFTARYNITYAPIEVDRSFSFTQITESVYQSLNIRSKNWENLRLAVINDNGYLRHYVNEENRYLLDTFPITVVDAPAIKSGEIIESLSQTIDCLLTDSHKQKHPTMLMENISQLHHFMDCAEFASAFLDANGLPILFLFTKALSNPENELTSDTIIEQLWLHLLSSLATLIDFKSFENQSSLFHAYGLDWSVVPEEFIISIIHCPTAETNWTCMRYCLLILSSFIKFRPSRVSFITQNDGPEFILRMIKLLDEMVEPTCSKPTKSSSFLKPRIANSTNNFSDPLKSNLRLELQFLLVNLVHEMLKVDSKQPCLPPSAVWQIVKENTQKYSRQQTLTDVFLTLPLHDLDSSLVRSSKPSFNWTTLKPLRRQRVERGNSTGTFDYSQLHQRSKLTASRSSSNLLDDSTPVEIGVEMPDDFQTSGIQLALNEIILNLQKIMLSEVAKTFSDNISALQLEKTLKYLKQFAFHESVLDEIEQLTRKARADEIWDDCGLKAVDLDCLLALVEHRRELVDQILRNRADPSARQSVSKWLIWQEINGGPCEFPLLQVIKETRDLLFDLFSDYDPTADLFQRIYPVLFCHPRDSKSAFMELFLMTFDSFYNGWSALNALPYDLDRVTRITARRLKQVLSENPFSFDEFCCALVRCNLDSVKHLQARDEETMQASHSAVYELRSDLTKLHTRTVQEQRLYMMSIGPPCECTLEKGQKKEKYRIKVSLSEDHKSLLVRNSRNVLVENWLIADIESVAPGIEEKKKKQPESTILVTFKPENAKLNNDSGTPPSIIPKDRRVILIAASSQEHFYWMDGFCVLNKYKLSSELFAEDLNNIVELELRVRLMGIDLSQVPNTPVPPPSTYPTELDLLPC